VNEGGEMGILICEIWGYLEKGGGMKISPVEALAPKIK
jgi:hypothetical protein